MSVLGEKISVVYVASSNSVLYRVDSNSVGLTNITICAVTSVASDSFRPHGLQPPGSSVHGTPQARILEWVARPSSRGSSQPRDQTHISLLYLVHWQVGSLPPAPPGKLLKKNNCYCCLVKSCRTFLQPHGLKPTRLLCPWDFPGKNTGVGWHFLLQGFFPTQGWNLRVLKMCGEVC